MFGYDTIIKLEANWWNNTYYLVCTKCNIYIYIYIYTRATIATPITNYS
ncbi:MAG: hypothetical protein N7Q72_03880 [Spiroplasma sp. Tabriz.8]|nr:hypothetical protein [Spiroplasma sp. Tabriz.8]